MLDSEPVSFRCSCSRNRIEGVLLAMGEKEITSVIEKEGQVKVDCDFCNRYYTFDRVDISALFSGSPGLVGPRTPH
jgi:molecular chaperone Hsp33